MNEEPFTPGGATATTAHPGAPHGTESPLHEKAASTGQSFQSEAQKLKGAAREHGAAAMDQVKEGLQSATHQAQEAGKTFFKHQQANIAARLGEYAEAARAASGRLQGPESNMLAQPAERAAESLERFSHYLQDKEPIDLMHDLESFARRRPEIVFGGLFVAGLAAARFLKASRRSLEDRQRARAIVPTTGPGAPSPAPFGSTTGVGSTGGIASTTGIPSTSVGTTPTTSPATSSIPPTTGPSTTPTIPPVSPGSSSTTGSSTSGTSTFPTNPSQPKSMP